MTARPRRSYTSEFKAQTVEFVRSSGKSVSQVCLEASSSSPASTK
jgi:transposase-like protein